MIPIYISGPFNTLGGVGGGSEGRVFSLKSGCVGKNKNNELCQDKKKWKRKNRFERKWTEMKIQMKGTKKAIKNTVLRINLQF